MGIFKFFHKVFFEDPTAIVESGDIERISIERFAINCGISLIAQTAAAAEFVTYSKGEKKKDEEYYLWNVQPNPRQNKSQFINQLVEQLIVNEEVLIIEKKGSLYIADSGFMTEKTYDRVAYSNVAINEEQIPGNFTSKNVMYLSLKNPKLRSLLVSAASDYVDLLSFSGKRLKKAAANKAVLKIEAPPAGETEEQRQRADEALRNNIKSFLGDEDNVLPIRKGMTYEDLSKNRVGDNPAAAVKEMTEEVFACVAEAMHIPKGILLGNVADVDKIRENFITLGVCGNILNQLEAEINAKRYGAKNYVERTALRINTNRINFKNIFGNASDAFNLIGSGVYSPDEIREAHNEEPLNTPESKRHYISLNYKPIEEEAENE